MALAPGLVRKVRANDRINMGFIGVGGMGFGHVRSFSGYPEVRAVTVCDVRKEHRDRAKAYVDRRYGDQACQAFNDYRELLSRPDIDAVCMATPDHWHALIGIEAARQGKHIYYEKPLTMSIRESKAVRRSVKQHGIVFQFGTQQRSDYRFRWTCDRVRKRLLGELQTIMIGSANYVPIPRQPVQPVPKGFDYDMWLGPAPWSPYTRERCTRQWTLISDYSLGCLSGAWGIHQVDIAQMALDSDDAVPLETEGTGFYPKKGLYDTVLEWQVEHRYPNGVKLIHMDMPTAQKMAPQFELHWMGVLFQGSEGWIYVCREGLWAEPASLLRTEIPRCESTLIPSNNQHQNFLDAIRRKKATVSPIDAAYHADLICHHADIAMRLNKRLEWDPVREEFKNDPKANRLMNRAMRSPWHL